MKNTNVTTSLFKSIAYSYSVMIHHNVLDWVGETPMTTFRKKNWRAPWALAAVGRGAAGEKTVSLVRTNDQLYKVEVKHKGLRTGTGRCGTVVLR